jgi:hypothetical protein
MYVSCMYLRCMHVYMYLRVHVYTPTYVRTMAYVCMYISLTECNSGTIKNFQFRVNTTNELNIITTTNNNNNNHKQKYTKLKSVLSKHFLNIKTET